MRTARLTDLMCEGCALQHTGSQAACGADALGAVHQVRAGTEAEQRQEHAPAPRKPRREHGICAHRAPSAPALDTLHSARLGSLAAAKTINSCRPKSRWRLPEP